MSLLEDFEHQGDWLFRRRGYFPLLIVPLLLAALYLSHPAWILDREPMESFWLALCVSLSMSGLAVRILVIGFVPSATSGRNTKAQRASTLNTLGMYSIMRHPLYLGNFLMALGMAAVIKVPWFILAYSLLYWLYYERIMFAEEAFLRKTFGEKFEQWSAKTPAFLPDFRLWQRPSLRFSWKMVLRREYPGLLLLAVGFTLLEVFEEALLEKESVHDLVWGLLAGGVTIALVLRYLKKETTILLTPER